MIKNFSNATFKRKNKKSLQRMLMLNFILLTIGIGVFSQIWIQMHFSDFVESQLGHRTEEFAEAVIYQIETAADLSHLQAYVQAMGRDSDIETIVVAGSRPPRVLAATNKNWNGLSLKQVPDPEHIANDLLRAIETGKRSLDIGHKENTVVDCTIPVEIRISEHPDGTLLSEPGAVMVHMRSAETEKEIKQAFLMFQILFALIAFLFLLITGLILRRMIFNPLQTIETLIRKKQQGDDEVIFPVFSSDELGSVTEAFNQLIGQQKMRETERQRLFNELEGQRKAIDQFAIVAETDARGKITYVNQRFIEISKYGKEELLGQDHRMVNSGYHSKSFFQEMWQVISNGKIWRGEIKNQAKDGSVYWVDTAIVPFIGSDGKPEKYLAIRAVITERKLAEEQRHRKMIETDMLHQAASLATQAKTPEEVLKSILDLICQKMKWPVGHAYQIADQNGVRLDPTGIWSIEDWERYRPFVATTMKMIFQTSQGLPRKILETKKPVWICKIEDQSLQRDQAEALKAAKLKSVIGFPVFVKEKIVAVLEFFLDAESEPQEDITQLLENIGHQVGRVLERQKFTNALEEARDKAIKASAAKSEFLTTMSHEIRTPMNAVLGMAELLEETSLDEEQIQYIKTLKHGGEALLTLINDVLDFSKIESGMMEIEEIETRLPELVEHLVEVLSVKVHKKGLKLNVNLACDIPQTVLTDPTRLRQVLMNLMGNAVKFTHQGEITLCVTRSHSVEEAFSKDHVWIQFEVKDTGIGIPEDRIQAIFEPFTQADSSTTRRYGGTGLGLSISKKIVEKMKGKFKVESKIGVGSTFQFTIPLKLKTTESLLVQDKTSSDLQGKGDYILDNQFKESTALKILLVDDSEDNRMLIKAYLKKEPHMIDIAENGEIAVQKVKNNVYDLVLMDMQMPVMDGYSAARLIREWKIAKKINISIIALTANALKEDAQKCLDAGCDAYLAKPIAKKQLLETLFQFATTSTRKGT